MTIVKIIQTFPHNWRIEAPSGAILQHGITLHTVAEAEAYVIRYISSWTGWGYEIVEKDIAEA